MSASSTLPRIETPTAPAASAAPTAPAAPAALAVSAASAALAVSAASAALAVSAAPEKPIAPRHTATENAVGIVVGAFIASLGLFLIKSAGAVTGGTAGLVLLLGHLVPWPFAALFALVNLPFVALAWARRGWRFVGASLLAVALLSAASLMHPAYLQVSGVNPLYGVLAGNLAAGIGLLIVFRHHASLGGFTVVALICQDRLGWRAGYVLLALDTLVVGLSALVLSPTNVLLSAAGAAVLNLVLVMNHRPGRYPAAG
ncbi:YitT family protein [Actinoplanes sp. NPDC051851]|uniref:YitT family protein n=1 Tax=Actinoplanes sp. NPDC051851 TaxID=3154753 RepID=UPI00342258C6